MTNNGHGRQILRKRIRRRRPFRAHHEVEILLAAGSLIDSLIRDMCVPLRNLQHQGHERAHEIILGSTTTSVQKFIFVSLQSGKGNLFQFLQLADFPGMIYSTCSKFLLKRARVLTVPCQTRQESLRSNSSFKYYFFVTASLLLQFSSFFCVTIIVWVKIFIL